MLPIKKLSLVALAVTLGLGGLAFYRYHDLNTRINEIKQIPATATNSLRVQIDPGMFSAKVVYSYETASPLFLKIVETGTVHYGLGYLFTGNITGDFDIFLEEKSKRISEQPVAHSTLTLKSNNDLIERGTILAVPDKMQQGTYEVSLTNKLSRLDATITPGNISIKNNGTDLNIEGTSLSVGFNVKNWTDSLFKLSIAKFQASPGAVENIKVSVHDEKSGSKRNFFTDLSANANFTHPSVPDAYKKVNLDFSASVEGVAETPYLFLISLMQNKSSVEPQQFQAKVTEFAQAIVSAGLTVNVKKASVNTSGGDLVDINATLALPQVLSTKDDGWSDKITAKSTFTLKGSPAKFVFDFGDKAFGAPTEAERFSIGYVKSEIQFNDKTATPEQMVLIRRLAGFFQQSPY